MVLVGKFSRNLCDLDVGQVIQSPGAVKMKVIGCQDGHKLKGIVSSGYVCNPMTPRRPCRGRRIECLGPENVDLPKW